MGWEVSGNCFELEGGVGKLVVISLSLGEGLGG